MAKKTMNFFRKKDAPPGGGGGGRLSPPPQSSSPLRNNGVQSSSASAPPDRGAMLSRPPARPRLDNAFADELRTSMHHLKRVPKKPEKKNRFDFLKGFRQRSSSDISESTPSTPKSPRKKLNVLQSPRKRTATLQSPKRRLDPPPVMLSPKPVREPTNREGPTRARPPRPSLSKDITEELQMSFTNRNAQKDRRHEVIARIQEKKMAEFPEDEEPEADIQKPQSKRIKNNPLNNFLHRIRQSSFDDSSVQSGQRSQQGQRSKQSTPSNRAPRRIDKNIADELRSSLHAKNLLNDDDEPIRPNPRPRPSLKAEVADELRQSIHKRIAAKADKRQQLVQRIQERRSKRDLVAVTEDESGENDEDDQGGRTYNKPLNDTSNDRRRDKTGQKSKFSKPSRPPSKVKDQSKKEASRNEKSGRSKSPKRESDAKKNFPAINPKLRDELRDSVHSRSEKKDKQRQEIAARIAKRREKERISNNPSSSGPKSGSKHSVNFDLSNHSMSMSSFASFEDDAERSHERINATMASRGGQPGNLRTDSNLSSGTFTGEFSDADILTKGRPGAYQRQTPLENRAPLEDISEIDGDFNDYKYEWARLIRDKKKAKESLSKYKLEASELAKDMQTYKSERDRMQDQLFDVQEKVDKLTRQQAEERKQFDNSTDLIAEARMDLAKALNDYRILQTQLSEYESSIASKDRRIDALNDALDDQTERVDDFLSKLQNAEHELHYQTEEKRRMEEELRVISAARDGKDVKKAIRLFEEERSRMLDDREQDLELMRKELGEEVQKVVARERERQHNEAEEMKRLKEKQRSREEELDRLQDEINQQLRGFQEENRAIKEKLNMERIDSAVELKKKDHSIALLEQEISNLKKSYATHRTAEREIEKQVAAAESAQGDLEDALRHKKVLEKELKRLQRDMTRLKDRADNWQEVVLPGHRNLHGVTFGNHNSDSLAGFLTILVEEQFRAAKKRDSKSSKSKLSKYVKEPTSRKKSGKKEKKDKKKKKKKDKDKDKGKKSKMSKKKDKKKKKKKKKSKEGGTSISGEMGEVNMDESVLDDGMDEADKKAKKREKKAKKKKREKKDKKKRSKDKGKVEESDDKTGETGDDGESQKPKKSKKSKKKSKKDKKDKKGGAGDDGESKKAKKSKKSKKDKKKDSKKDKKGRKDKKDGKSKRSSSKKGKDKVSGSGYPLTIEVKPSKSSKKDKKKSRGSERSRSPQAILLQ